MICEGLEEAVLRISLWPYATSWRDAPEKQHDELVLQYVILS